MNAIVLYKSKYGASRRYAQLLAAELSCEAREVGAHSELAENCNWAIFVGGVYAGTVAGLRAFERAVRGHAARPVVLCVGASPADGGEVERLGVRVRRGALADAAVFYARGAWDEQAMTLRDRVMCGLLRRAAAGRGADSCEPWLRELLSSSVRRNDWFDRGYILPLLECVRAGD